MSIQTVRPVNYSSILENLSSQYRIRKKHNPRQSDGNVTQNIGSDIGDKSPIIRFRKPIPAVETPIENPKVKARIIQAVMSNCLSVINRYYRLGIRRWATNTNYSLLFIFLRQFPRALERDHPPGPQHHRITGRRIPALASLFIIHTEFTEPADKDVIPGCQCRFDGFDEQLDHLGALFLGNPS